MAEFRILLLVMIVGLVIFAVQNLSLSLPLVFLNLQTQALPISVWICGAIAAGVLSAILFSALFRFSNYLAEPEWQARPRPRPPVAPPPSEPQYRRWEAEPRRDQAPQPSVSPTQNVVFSTTQSPDLEIPRNPSVYQTPSYSPTSDVARENPSQTQPLDTDDEFEWEEGDDNLEPVPVVPRAEEEEDEFDWEEDEDSENPTIQSSQISDTTQSDAAKAYERSQAPMRESWSGSIYSYTYKRDEVAGERNTESIYDADYRIIEPPEPETPPRVEPIEPVKPGEPQQEPQDDWGRSQPKKDDWDWE